MQDDFTFEAMERRARIAKGSPLTDDELATIKKQAEKIAELERTLEAAKEAEEIAEENAGVTRTYQAMLKEMGLSHDEVHIMKFNCPHCTQRVSATEDIAGENCQCPTCGGKIQVPKA